MKPALALLMVAFFSMPPSTGADQPRLSAATPQKSLLAQAAAAPDPRTTLPRAVYRHETDRALPANTVKSYSSAWVPVETRAEQQWQWFILDATKANGQRFRFWILTSSPLPETTEAARQRIARFILQQGASAPCEFRHRLTGRAVLPSLGGWPYLLPQPSVGPSRTSEDEKFPKTTRYLGHSYRLESVEQIGPDELAPPAAARVVELLPDLMVGVPSNTRQKDETRRYNGSDYELIRLRREDFQEMAAAGINCVRVDPEQLPWLENLGLFYWGIGGADLSYPECLYDSRYLGPALFLDEPAVCTRDYVIRPKLAQDKDFRRALTPQNAFDAFKEYFRRTWQEGAATSLVKGLAARRDVDLGDLRFLQENLFSWETMVSTAVYQLSQNPVVPAAMVFEPPGRVGTRRTLPELDMTYGCQLATDDPKNFIDIIYGFLRGAARLTGKEWGTSIYGAVDRADAPWFLTHAYDLGATRFFFWDNAQLACVPHGECLALARQLKMRAQNFPQRDLDRLSRAAEVAILLPAGYNLGHVHLGKGSLWGLGELNLERLNTQGVRYRDVMSNFFVEIERCLRLGIAFDLFSDLPDLNLTDYREVVRVREDGKVELASAGRHSVLAHARTPVRPAGAPPQLSVELSEAEGRAPLAVTARATVAETTAPIYYTFGTDASGVYHNAMVAWEVYGPDEADYRFITPAGLKPRVEKNGVRSSVIADFKLERPGSYRLRAATVDLAGRSAVVWKTLRVTE